MMSRLPLRCCAVLLSVIVVAGCSPLPYAARPLDQDAALTEYAQRSATTDGLKRFAIANGYAEPDWPPRQWGLRELTLVALYFHPEMRIARARADLARAQRDGAALRPGLGARVRPEYHARELPEDNGPWTLGLELEIPLTAQGKREARIERSAFLADAADLDVAAAAWTVRAGVRDRLVELQSDRDTLAALEAQIAARREMLGLVERRVQAGMLSTHELGTERLALSQLEVARDQQSSLAQRRLAELALALGVPPEMTAAMELRFDAELPAVQTEAAELRGLALRNRLDVHRKLLEFGAADAEVKLAVASQNPDITLGPGYAWDQGDNIWSLAVGFSIPSGAQARAHVRESETQREVAAQQFLATQMAAIASTEAAAAGYRSALRRLAAARRQQALQQEQEARVVRQFDAGGADRLQRVTARVETLAADGAVRLAHTDSRQSLARLEDAVQRPLFGDFSALPDMRSAKHEDASKQ
ncbi:MAG TPA: TolC family protein [Burkholderiales bacterium]